MGCQAIRVTGLPPADWRRCHGAVADGRSVAAGSAEGWRAVRAVLTANRHELGRVAAGLYPGLPRAGSADLLCREEWIPPVPLGLDDLPVTWDGGPSGEDDGQGRYDGASAQVRPLLPDGGRYASYTAAVAALDRPALFENRPCTGCSMPGWPPRQGCGSGRQATSKGSTSGMRWRTSLPRRGSAAGTRCA